MSSFGLDMNHLHGAAKPACVRQVGGHDRHVQDSLLISGYARTLTAARHLQVLHLLRSAPESSSVMGVVPRLETKLLVQQLLIFCGVFISFP